MPIALGGDTGSGIRRNDAAAGGVDTRTGANKTVPLVSSPEIDLRVGKGFDLRDADRNLAQTAKIWAQKFTDQFVKVVWSNSDKLALEKFYLFSSRCDLATKNKFLDLAHELFQEINFNPVSGKSKEFRAGIIDNLTIVVSVASSFPLELDSKLIKDLALSFACNTQKTRDYLEQLYLLYSSTKPEEIKVAARVLTNLAIQNEEDPVLLLKSMRELLENPKLKIAGGGEVFKKSIENIVDFLGGLAGNDWDIIASVIILNDALDKQADPEAVLGLAARCSRGVRSDSRPAWRRKMYSQTPAVLDLAIVDSISEEEIRVADLLLISARSDEAKLGNLMRKYFLLCEACRYCDCEKTPKNILTKIERSIFDKLDLEQVLDLQISQIARRADDLSIRRSIEALMKARSQEEHNQGLELLRSIYRADVVYKPILRDTGEENRFAQQKKVLAQALKAFGDFRELRAFVKILSAELSPHPDGHFSLFSRFANQISAGNSFNLHCTPDLYPGAGTEVVKLQAARALNFDKQNPSDPLAAYTGVEGWNKQLISDLLSSRIFVTPYLFTISVPGLNDFNIHGSHRTLVVFLDQVNGQDCSQIALVSSDLFWKTLDQARYPLTAHPSELPKLKNLGEAGCYAEFLEVESQRLGLPYLDIGSPTNIGGFSNSKRNLVDGERLTSAVPPNFFGRNEDLFFDPWGNRIKQSLLADADGFSKHLANHKEILAVVERLNSVGRAFINRYAAWKRGDLGVTADPNGELVATLQKDPSLLMLHEFLALHLKAREFGDLDLASSKKPLVRFYDQNRLAQGAVPDFYFDLANARWVIGNETFNYPKLDLPEGQIVTEDLIAGFCSNKKIIGHWQTFVWPLMRGKLSAVEF